MKMPGGNAKGLARQTRALKAGEPLTTGRGRGRVTPAGEGFARAIKLPRDGKNLWLLFVRSEWVSNHLLFHQAASGSRTAVKQKAATR